MPRGDRTGPWGEGPRTGRAAGYCAGYPYPGYANDEMPPMRMGRGGGRGLGRGRGFGRGYGGGGGFGRGGGRGFGWGFRVREGQDRWDDRDYPLSTQRSYPPARSREDELKMLEEEETALENELKALRKHVKKLRSAEPKKKEAD